MGVRRDVVLVGALALALSEAHARAGWWPPERPPTSVEGPCDTCWALEASDRLRGEFVDYFKANPGLKKPDFRYDFLANRSQAGIRVRRDPWEAFFQFQHTVLDDIPSGAPRRARRRLLRQHEARLPGAGLAAPGLGERGGSLRGEGRRDRRRAPALA